VCIAAFGAFSIAPPAAVAGEYPTMVKHKKAKPTRARRARRAAPSRPAPARQPAPTDVSSAQPNWTGTQAGGNAGASGSSSSFVEPGAYLSGFGVPVETPFEFKDRSVSGRGGVFLGYRVQMGRFVVGVEGDANWKQLSETEDQTTVRNEVGPGSAVTEYFRGKMGQGWDGSFRARFGVLVTPWTLIYGTGGVAFGEVTGSFTYLANCVGGPCDGVSVTGSRTWSDTRVGYTVGGGGEMAVAPGFKVRVEYRYTDLGDFSENVPLAAVETGGGSCAASSCGTNARIDLSAAFHSLTFGVGIDF